MDTDTLIKLLAKNNWKIILVVWIVYSLFSGFNAKTFLEEHPETVIIKLPKFIDTKTSFELFVKYNTSNYMEAIEKENCVAYKNFFEFSLQYLLPYMVVCFTCFTLLILTIPKRKEPEDGDDG